MKMTQEERFWLKVNKDGPLPDQSNPHYAGLDKCWEWTAYKLASGYGAVGWDNTVRLAHRVSKAISERFDLTQSKVHVLHKCDNPSCVNPDHLFYGDPLANTKDMILKGRGNPPTGERHGSVTKPERIARGDRNGSRTKPDRRPCGGRIGIAVLTEAQVVEIREKRREEKLPYRVLAQIFGVSLGTIAQVVVGKTWRHVSNQQSS